LLTAGPALPVPGAPGAGAALAGSDCSGAREAAERKIGLAKEREAERRREAFAQEDPESLFRQCLGGITAAPAAAGFPPLPDLEDAVESLCRSARRGLGSPSLSPSGSFGLPMLGGGNVSLPWTGALSEDIWDALRQY
jgi:hypothetical protein